MNDSPGRPSPGSEDAGPPAPGAPESAGLPGQADPPAAERTGGEETAGPATARDDGDDSGAGEAPAAGVPAPGIDPARDSGPDLTKPSAPSDGPAPHTPQAPGGHIPPQAPPPGYGPGYGPGQTPGYPGYGQAPGPGYSQAPYAYPGGVWTPPPPTPKPGVIPLRPLNVGDIFEGAFATLRRHWRPALTVSAVVSVVMGVATTIVNGRLLRSPAYTDILNGHPSSLHELGHAYSSLSLDGTIEVVIAVLGQIIATSMLIMLVSRAVLGRTATVAEIWRDALPRMPRLLGLLLMTGVIVLGVVGVGVLPGILVIAAGSTAAGAALAVLGGGVATAVACWLLVGFSLATPALILERQGVFASLARSFKLVRGSWWRVLGILLLASVLSYVINGVLQAILGAFTNGPGIGGNPFSVLNSPQVFTAPSWTSIILMGVGTTIASLFDLPISAAVTSLLYMDQRIRREALDVELAAAAGVEAPPAH